MDVQKNLHNEVVDREKTKRKSHAYMVTEVLPFKKRCKICGYISFLNNGDHRV